MQSARRSIPGSAGPRGMSVFRVSASFLACMGMLSLFGTQRDPQAVYLPAYQFLPLGLIFAFFESESEKTVSPSLMQGVEIRIATDEDRAAIEAAVAAVFGRSARSELSQGSSSEDSIFIAVWQSAVVGSGFIRWSGPGDSQVFGRFADVPEIYRLSVHEDFQRQGIGSALIAEMEKVAASRGYGRVGVRIAQNDSRALSCFRRRGFVPVAIADRIEEFEPAVTPRAARTIRDRCRFMVKASISPQAGPIANC